MKNDIKLPKLNNERIINHTSKRRKNILMIMILTIVLLAGAISIAYFNMTSEDKNQTMGLTNGTMALRFADNDNGINAELSFGNSVTKKFIIENTGTLESSLSLDWLNLVNTYLNRSLSYNLTYSDTKNGEYREIIPETNVPTSSKPITGTIAGELSVPAGMTYYYNLTITLNNLPDVEQSSDLNAEFTTQFTVANPSKYRYYTLRVDPSGGTWNTFTGVQEYQLMNNDTMEIPNPTRTGYSFDGWTLEGESTELNGTSLSMGISDASLTARWTAKKVTVDVNGTQEEVDFGTTIDLPNPEKEGYTFTGWETTGGTIENNTLTVDTEDDITVTPTYVINKYKYIVYHNQMNVTGVGYTLVGADTDEGEADYNSTITPPVKTYTGFTSPQEKSLTIQSESVYPPVKNKIDYNYDRDKYEVTIDINGTTTTEEMYYGASKDLGTPTKTGYDFANWSVTGGTIDGNIFTVTGENPTVTANFTPKTFSVTFNANGGTTPLGSKTVTYDATYGDLPEPTYEGYDFVGWFTDGTEGTEVVSSTQVALSGNQTLYAHWEAKGWIQDAVVMVKNGQVPTNIEVGNPNFATAATTDEGVYALEDDYGTSYYYRGASQTNYIKYGKNKDGQDMWWRIIRINGDGSLRIVYDGTQAYANGVANNSRYAKVGQAWNTQYKDTKYVGYMFGGANGTASTSKAGAQANDTNSEAKTAVDTWYKENIVDTGYGTNVVDAIFCNDRSTPGKATTGFSSDTGLGYGTNVTAYGATVRTGVWNSATVAPQPKFTCGVKNDAFTVNESDKGNGKLTYPVGLITADEIMAAGSGKYATSANQSYYLHKSSSYFGWSLSPSYMNTSGRAYVFIVHINGSLDYTSPNITSGAVAPVINLSADYVNTLKGEGTMTNPYVP